MTASVGLAEVADAVAEAVGAGDGLVRALGRAAEEVGGATGATLRETVDRISLGDDADDAIARWAIAAAGDDGRLFAATLRMHRRAGGPLAATLASLASTLREREELREELDALTAQARLSARIVTWLPFGFLGFLILTNGARIVGVFVTPIGALVLGLGIGLQAIARRWIGRIVRVET